MNYQSAKQKALSTIILHRKWLNLLAIVGMLLIVQPALTQAAGVDSIQSGLGEAAGTAGLKTSQGSLPAMAGLLINSALSVLGIVLLGYLLYGGFRWMTAGGDSAQVDKAKATLRNAVIGLVIIVASYAIADFVLGELLKATSGGTTSGAIPATTP
ncbi:hypothetical protein KKG46_04755 [Patescibacteria group bacterium]|nr:hypothetical protein [Patescibacteria group bacterium]